MTFSLVGDQSWLTLPSMRDWDAYPPALSEVAQLRESFLQGDFSVDFEAYPAFSSEPLWFLEASDAPAIVQSRFRVIGRDCSGGTVAIWLVREDADIADQPVVFVGSEGEAGTVAADLSDFLWLLAAGWGPMEAVWGGADYDPYREFDDAELAEIAEEEPIRFGVPREDIAEVASRHARGPRRTATEVISRAKGSEPNFLTFLSSVANWGA